MSGGSSGTSVLAPVFGADPRSYVRTARTRRLCSVSGGGRSLVKMGPSSTDAVQGNVAAFPAAAAAGKASNGLMCSYGSPTGRVSAASRR
jgi:hypothetical protein